MSATKRARQIPREGGLRPARRGPVCQGQRPGLWGGLRKLTGETLARRPRHAPSPFKPRTRPRGIRRMVFTRTSERRARTSGAASSRALAERALEGGQVVDRAEAQVDASTPDAVGVNGAGADGRGPYTAWAGLSA
jgi:hypothetical protein